MQHTLSQIRNRPSCGSQGPLCCQRADTGSTAAVEILLSAKKRTDGKATQARDFIRKITHPDAVVFGVGVDHTPFPEEEIHAGPALRFFYCIALLLLKVPCIAVQYAISPREQLFLVRLKLLFLVLLLLLCEPGRVLPISSGV